MIAKLKKWGRHILNILVNPKQFFSRIVADGNTEESMLKAFIYGLIGGMAVLFINLVGGAAITFSSVFSHLIITPFLAVGLLFVMSGLLMLVSEITGGERDWEIAVKGLASVFFIYPVMLIINALAFNCTSLWIISILVDGYFIFLLYNIAVYCMRGNKIRVGLVIAAFIIFMITIYISDYRYGWLMIKNASAAIQCLS
ncbi:MAG: hypothetical protein LBL75_01175 [Rickettsiales bacterium]|jgi:hypothetical protein|nr:hypothetical protein [Rickettsiales bacterium]